MVDYLEIARRGRKQEPRSAPVADLQVTGPQARKLLTASWKPKERCGKIIWQRPHNGFYYSKEVSLHLLNQKEHTGQERGNRKVVTQRESDT